MKIAIVAAGFTPAEADGLRRAMAAFRRHGQIEHYQRMLIDGMVGRGYDRELRRALLQADRGLRLLRLPGEPRRQLRAAGLRLVLAQMPYPGRLLRRDPQHPADGLLCRRPSSSATPSTTASRCRPADVNYSLWDSTLEPLPAARAAEDRGPPRLARRSRAARGEADRIVAARLKPYRTLEELKRRARRARATLVTAGRGRRLPLARARPPPGAVGGPGAQGEACRCSTTPWTATPAPAPTCRPSRAGDEPWLELPADGPGRARDRGLRHPAAVPEGAPAGAAARLARTKRAITARGLWDADPGRRVTVCGLVLVRQRPGSAKGVIFTTLEDETGFANLHRLAQPLRALPGHRHDRPPAGRHRHACSARAASSTSSPSAWPT